MHIHAYIGMHMHACAHMRHIKMHARVRAHIHEHIHTCMYALTYRHTHAHTQSTISLYFNHCNGQKYNCLTFDTHYNLVILHIINTIANHALANSFYFSFLLLCLIYI